MVGSSESDSVDEDGMCEDGEEEGADEPDPDVGSFESCSEFVTDLGADAPPLDTEFGDRESEPDILSSFSQPSLFGSAPPTYDDLLDISLH